MDKAKASVRCDSSRCRLSQTSANKHDLRLATVRREQINGTLSSLVAMFDDHVVDDVTAAPVDRLGYVNKPPPSEPRDSYFRSLCEVCVEEQSQRPSTGRSYRLGDEAVNNTAREHLVDALRDSHLTSHDEFPFPVVNGAAADDVSANQQRHDDVMTGGDWLGRRQRTMTSVKQRVSEWSGDDGSIVCSDSVTSDDTSKCSRLS